MKQNNKGFQNVFKKYCASGFTIKVSNDNFNGDFESMQKAG